eukprot:gene29617-48510_t
MTGCVAVQVPGDGSLCDMHHSTPTMDKTHVDDHHG